MYENDHDPPHVHVFKDGKPIGRFDLVTQSFLPGSDESHLGRVRRALKKTGLIGEAKHGAQEGTESEQE